MATLFGLATGDQFTCTVHNCMVQEYGKTYAVKGACSEAKGTCGEPRNARSGETALLLYFGSMFFCPLASTHLMCLKNTTFDRLDNSFANCCCSTSRI